MKIYFRGKLFDTEAKGYIFYKNINFPDNMKVPFAAIAIDKSKTIYFESNGTERNATGGNRIFEEPNIYKIMTAEEILAEPRLAKHLKDY